MVTRPHHHWRMGLLAAAAVCAMIPIANVNAQENALSTAPSATPSMAVDGPPLQRITPDTMDAAGQGIYTTHKQSMGNAPAAVPAASSAASPTTAPLTLPWVKASPAAPAPVQAIAPLNAPASAYTGTKIPFGRGSSPGPTIPSAPHTATAVPVVDVDAVEAATPEPATPVAPAADPAKEDPAQPTDLTSPIFDATSDSGAARTMSLRVLNKVTGQSALMEARPGETIKFGQIEIHAIMCRASAPTSQTDYAGLLDIREYLPGRTELKPLFHGWMYASSPSITALEHPVYVVSMVACSIAKPVPPEPAPEAKPDRKPAKKSGRKA